MPIPRIIPNTVDVHYRYTYASQLMENVFQYIYTTIPTTANLLSLATEVANAFLPKYQALMPDDVIFTEVRADDIGAAGRATATYQFPANTHGTSTADPLPGNVAANMVLLTGKRGKSYRGSKRFSPFAEDQVSGETFSAAVLAALLDFGLQILLKRVTSTMTPGVGSQKLNVTTPLTSIAVRDFNVDSQKTRLIGHGR